MHIITQLNSFIRHLGKIGTEFGTRNIKLSFFPHYLFQFMNKQIFSIVNVKKVYDCSSKK